MSFIEIPDWLYEQILRTEIASLEGMGFKPAEARREALIRMGRGFVARSGAMAKEFQKDYDEYIEEMSLGGQAYEVPR